MNQQSSQEGSNWYIAEQQRANEALFSETANEVHKHLGETAAYLYETRLLQNGMYQDKISFGPTGEIGQNPLSELSTGILVSDKDRYSIPEDTRMTVDPTQHSEQLMQAPQPNNVIDMRAYRENPRRSKRFAFPEGPEVIPYTPRRRRQGRLARFAMSFSRGRGQRAA